MSDEIKKIEAILFAAGKRVELDYIAKLIKISDLQTVKDALVELQKQYEDRESPLMIVEEGNSWKLTTKEKYLPLVQKIVPHAELSKTIMETLAVIAWKQPALQSDVIKIRTNKAYEHIKELEDLGFVTSEKHGRTKKLKVTQKFLNYFDLKGYEDVRDLFKDMKIEKDTEEKLGKLEVYDEGAPPVKQGEEPITYNDSDESERVKEVNEELGVEFGSEQEEPREVDPNDLYADENQEDIPQEGQADSYDERREDDREDAPHGETRFNDDTPSDERAEDTYDEQVEESGDADRDEKEDSKDKGPGEEKKDNIFSPGYGKPKKTFDEMLDE